MVKLFVQSSRKSAKLAHRYTLQSLAMKTTYLYSKGFTLVELMVTLVIALIITAVTIPTMNRYITQGKISDAIVAATELQAMIVKQIAAKESVTNSGTGLTLPSGLGRYVASFSVSANGVISITTTSMSGSSNAISLTLTPAYNTSNERVTWTCAVTSSANNDYVPSKCRI